MIDDRKSGIALVAGSLGSLLTMAIHPTASFGLSVDEVARLSIVSGIAHSIAIVSILLLFLGACGLSHRLASKDRITFAAIIVFGFACIAILIAAAVSGFIIPNIMQRMIRDAPAAASTWRIVIVSVFQFNQAFAQIFSVASSMAIILWSVSALRSGRLGKGIALYGCFSAALLILGIAIGHLRLDVHGMTIVAIGQTIWFMVVGSQMFSRSPSHLPPSLP